MSCGLGLQAMSFTQQHIAADAEVTRSSFASWLTVAVAFVECRNSRNSPSSTKPLFWLSALSHIVLPGQPNVTASWSVEVKLSFAPESPTVSKRMESRSVKQAIADCGAIRSEKGEWTF